MKRKRRNSHAWVYLIWGVNITIALCVITTGGFYLTNQNAYAANELQVETQNPNHIQVAPPTSYFLPTLTPNPFYTPPVFETSTPFVLAYGPHPTIIGYSLAGRPIEAYSFGTGIKEYLIVAGIHGGYEQNTIGLANEMIKYINDHPEVIPDGSRLYIIRNMNPDGEARANGVDGRVNNNGVDLNRNFPTENWAKDWNRDGCWTYPSTTGGTYGGSEPETRTVTSFISSRNIQAMVSYHSAALGVFPGGVPWEADSIQLAKSLANVTGYPYPPLDTGCIYTGTLADWAVENGVGAAVDMELTNHKDTDFNQNLKALVTLLNFVP